MFKSPLIDHLSGYVAGKFLPDVDAKATSKVVVSNPANGERLAELPSLGANETRLAIAAAERNLLAVPSLEARKKVLDAIVAAHLDNKDELARLITLENGKPLAESQGEVEYAAGFYRETARHLDIMAPKVLKDRPRGLTWTVYKRPAGVVGLITPWNFPLGMLAKKLSSAIGAGAPCVVKPAEKTPLSTIALFHLLHKIGLPPGAVNLVFGDAPAIGKTLSEHPSVRVLSFTGSTPVGKLLAAQSAAHMKRLSLELGGNAPFIVFDDADLDLAADQLMTSKFRCAGQTCVCANRVYVAEKVSDAFVGKVADRVRALKMGSGLEPGVTIGPLIDRGAFEKVQRLVQDAIQKGASPVVGGSAELPGSATGFFFPPTVLSGVKDGMKLLDEEVFGPVVPIQAFKDETAVLEAANRTEYGLAAYVFTKDKARSDRLLAGLRFGHVGLNSGSGPTPEAPFGGMKHSGLGREGGEEGLLEMVELQTVPSA